MFSFFKKKPVEPVKPATPAESAEPDTFGHSAVNGALPRTGQPDASVMESGAVPVFRRQLDESVAGASPAPSALPQAAVTQEKTLSAFVNARPAPGAEISLSGSPRDQAPFANSAESEKSSSQQAAPAVGVAASAAATVRNWLRNPFARDQPGAPELTPAAEITPQTAPAQAEVPAPARPPATAPAEPPAAPRLATPISPPQKSEVDRPDVFLRPAALAPVSSKAPASVPTPAAGHPGSAALVQPPAPVMRTSAAPTHSNPGPTPVQARAPAATATTTLASSLAQVAPTALAATETADKPASRSGWMDRLRGGLRKTGSSITTVFTGTRIDETLYEELEDALLMADTGVKATQHLLVDLKRRVKDTKTTNPAAVRGLLADALTELLLPLEKALVVGEFTPTVIMVAGVNGAGKTTSIGKLTRHLAEHGASVLLAAADTFRAAAREQLGVWADRNTVEIISQEGGDPAAVSFDAVAAGRARRKDVVLVDTAGRLPTQIHLMEELRKIRRTIAKAGAAAGPAGVGTPPHEVLLVIDGNTGQNALSQVRAFDDALQLTGLIVTKLDGTAKGGVLAAIAQERPVPVYFIGVGEKLEDLQTFNAREFAQALLG